MIAIFAGVGAFVVLFGAAIWLARRHARKGEAAHIAGRRAPIGQSCGACPAWDGRADYPGDGGDGGGD